MSEGITEVGARLTIVQSTYYQSPGLEADSRDNKFEIKVELDEQPYYRHLKLNPSECAEINTGWIDDPSAVLIENIPNEFQAIPSPQEKERAKTQIIEVVFNEGTRLLILPGDSLRLMIKDLETLEAIKLYNPSDLDIRYSLTAYPR